MDCPNCSTPQPDAARFCARCGTPLHPAIDRSRHFAAHPDEPVRALAVVSTLMPHLAGGRHHIYRGAIVLALLAALVAAAFGVLSIALVLAAIALPAAVLTYVHDHDAWRDEPIIVIGVAVLLSLALGVGVGLLEHYFTMSVVLAAPDQRLPALTEILELGVLIPVVGFVAVLIAPMLITVRSAFRHPVDAVVICSLSGAALSLGLSVVVQHGAFTRIGARAGEPANAFAGLTIDPGQAAFIALTLGFLQPVIFATAAAMAVVPLRGPGVNVTLGLAKGLVLVTLYELVTTLLTPYGTRGVMLTTLAALVLAAAGLIGARDTLHASLLAEAQRALTGDRALSRAPDTDHICAHCGATIGAGAAFCQVCGIATAALARHPSGSTASQGATMSPAPPPPNTSPPHYPGSGARVGHRRGPVAIAAVIAVVILIAAALAAAVVLTGTTNRPKVPVLPNGHAAMPAPAKSGIARPPGASDQLARVPRTVPGGAVALTSADSITIGRGISITPAPGWIPAARGPDWVILHNADSSAQLYVRVKPATATDVTALLQADINQVIMESSGALSNMKNLSGPATKTLQSANFQQQASIDYTADVSTQQGTIPILGAFDELLNTSSDHGVQISV
ncbi:zinc ribbon domain-containing protein [Mycobacterium nebraskense]|uniref:zinc ribbon domain-containing protein n=1 Tax=Mycobacterium nebraskense TaxID=244292 RepID=UPI000A63EFAD|nr:zinc ribbon domain-containing protein [Mycobacterium nebraskense]